MIKLVVGAPVIGLAAIVLVVTPVHAANASQTLRIAFPIAETTFDPAVSSDGVSDAIIGQIMEAMLDYDYLVRPVKLVPRTLEAIPAVQLLYGPNIGQENVARFNLSEFNKLYEEAQRLPDSLDRTKLFDRMTELVVAYVPWHTIDDTLAHPWVRNYALHPIRFSGHFQYVDIDEAAKAKARR